MARTAPGGMASRGLATPCTGRSCVQSPEPPPRPPAPGVSAALGLTSGLTPAPHVPPCPEGSTRPWAWPSPPQRWLWQAAPTPPQGRTREGLMGTGWGGGKTKEGVRHGGRQGRSELSAGAASAPRQSRRAARPARRSGSLPASRLPWCRAWGLIGRPGGRLWHKLEPWALAGTSAAHSPAPALPPPAG